MKIVASVRAIYDERAPIYEQLKKDVDSFFASSKSKNWHYESRIKSLQSFALKAETGRFEKISELEDFFGACLVVENSSSIGRAIRLIEERYDVVHKRPSCQDWTHKNPDSFVFDDLRLYVKIPVNPARKPKGIENITFEIQVKTFLQHAWSIATHDLIYKGEESSWATSRIAFQVKAMLEHAEISIMESAQLSSNQLLNKTNKNYKLTQQLIGFIKSTWQSEQLPSDLVRLASSVSDLMKVFKLDFNELKTICEASSILLPSPPINVSPKIAITLAIVEYKENFQEALQSGSAKLFIPDEGLVLLSGDKREAIEDFRLFPS